MYMLDKTTQEIMVKITDTLTECITINAITINAFLYRHVLTATQHSRH